jgi:hypothetical protein
LFAYVDILAQNETGTKGIKDPQHKVVVQRAMDACAE